MLLFPDVYEALLQAGASDFSIAEKIRGEPEPADKEMVYLSVRRPVVEWALWQAVLHEPHIEVRFETRVCDLLLEDGDLPTVRGVLTDAGKPIRTDLLIDAQGRTTSFPGKLSVAGHALTTENSKTHIVYYSRYFQMRPGEQFPRGPWLTTPRGDLGYAGYSSFTGDNRTFALVLAVGSWDHDLRILQHEAAWDAAAAAIPALAPLADPEFAAPITPVLAMGELQNTLRHYVEGGRLRVRGMIPVGDTVCHTDPTFALGLSFALIHARALQSAIESSGSDIDSIPLAFWTAVYPEVRERYDLAVATDDARAEMWQGKRQDVFHATGSYPLFTMVAAALAAARDDEILRKTVRRIGFLDRLAVFDKDVILHRKIERTVADILTSSPMPQPVVREQLLDHARRALTAGGAKYDH
jgi:2-polyprenyl-6-methoxyphenol hydroxylase-like FAD-dependent oxidoreductase